MSNHNGSYMLNHVLKLMDEYRLFEHLGREQTQQFVLQVLQLGWRNDCNNSEILEGIST